MKRPSISRSFVQRYAKIAARWIGLLSGLTGLSGMLYGQVSNDAIERRIALQPNGKPLVSTTQNCTVQWNCVDESLTGKCIEYHNDQWFEFTASTAGTYFVNISRQDCRDIRGVQLVVMEGTPCQPATYQVLSCTSLATQDDIFVTLPTVAAHRPYLLNIDGYLNDFCRFEIQVSTRPRGLPARHEGEEIGPSVRATQAFIPLEWSVSDTLGALMTGYAVYRRHEKEKKSTLLRRLSHERNTRGESLLQYSLMDTVAEKGAYMYQVIGLRNDSTPVRIADKTVHYLPDTLRPEDYLMLRLHYALNTPLTVLIFDDSAEILLQRIDFTYQRKGLGWQYYVGWWRKRGIYRFRVKVTDNLRKNSREYRFDTRTED